MNPLLQKIKTDNKAKRVKGEKRPIIYSRVLTNRMTIVAHKLFKKDPVLHLALIIYRLKTDFGFKHWEIANFTGVPMTQIAHLQTITKKLLHSEILKILGKMDYEGQLHEWRDMPYYEDKKPQGYYIVREYPAYYSDERIKALEERYGKEPWIKLGGESEKEMMKELENAK